MILLHVDTTEALRLDKIRKRRNGIFYDIRLTPSSKQHHQSWEAIQECLKPGTEATLHYSMSPAPGINKRVYQAAGLARE